MGVYFFVLQRTVLICDCQVIINAYYYYYYYYYSKFIPPANSFSPSILLFIFPFFVTHFLPIISFFCSLLFSFPSPGSLFPATVRGYSAFVRSICALPSAVKVKSILTFRIPEILHEVTLNALRAQGGPLKRHFHPYSSILVPAADFCIIIDQNSVTKLFRWCNGTLFTLRAS